MALNMQFATAVSSQQLSTSERSDSHCLIHATAFSESSTFSFCFLWRDLEDCPGWVPHRACTRFRSRDRRSHGRKPSLSRTTDRESGNLPQVRSRSRSDRWRPGGPLPTGLSLCSFARKRLVDAGHGGGRVSVDRYRTAAPSAWRPAGNHGGLSRGRRCPVCRVVWAYFARLLTYLKSRL